MIKLHYFNDESHPTRPICATERDEGDIRGTADLHEFHQTMQQRPKQCCVWCSRHVQGRVNHSD